MHIGDHVLVGPMASVSGATIGDEVFLATGTRVFNGARIGERSEVRINAVVHLRTVLPPETVVPIGWVAVGDPVQILSPDRHEEIWAAQRELDFPGYVFGLDRDTPDLMVQLTERYGRGLAARRRPRSTDGDQSQAGAAFAASEFDALRPVGVPRARRSTSTANQRGSTP